MSEQIDYSEYTKQTLEELRDSQQRFAAKKAESRHIISTSEMDYWKRVQETPDPREPVHDMSELDHMLKVRVNEQKPLGLTYEDGRKILWRVIQTRQLREQIERNDKTFKYTFNDSQKLIINNLIRYFMGHDCDYSRSKGIYLYGNVGRGKTQIMEIFKDFTQQLKFMKYEVVSTSGIVFDVQKEKNTAIMQPYFRSAMCFDDFGFEEGKSNIWGNRVRVMETIMTERYNARALTHATSNIPPDHLKDVYDSRIVSRCNQMFNYIMIMGIDHRSNSIKQ